MLETTLNWRELEVLTITADGAIRITLKHLPTGETVSRHGHDFIYLRDQCLRELEARVADHE